MLFEIARLSKESHFSTRSHWTRLAFKKLSCIPAALTADLGTVEIDPFHTHQPTWTQRGHAYYQRFQLSLDLQSLHSNVRLSNGALSSKAPR